MTLTLSLPRPRDQAATLRRLARQPRRVRACVIAVAAGSQAANTATIAWELAKTLAQQGRCLLACSAFPAQSCMQETSLELTIVASDWLQSRSAAGALERLKMADTDAAHIVLDLGQLETGCAEELWSQADQRIVVTQQGATQWTGAAEELREQLHQEWQHQHLQINS